MSDTTLHPVGSVVEYHGSISYKHGQYRVVVHHPSRAPQYYQDENPNEYPGGLAYALLPVDSDDPNSGLNNVRHKNVTLVSLPPESGE